MSGGLPAGLILCGGEARRLGGIDKPLRALGGVPLVQRVIERLRPQVGRLLISANRHQADYAALGAEVVGDGEHRHAGPLAGLLAGLARLDDGDLLCVPGDAPALPHDLGARLRAARGDAAIAYARDADGPQPLCCLVPARLGGDLRAYLEAGGRTPREWFQRHAAVTADFSDVPDGAWSLNTEDEWQAAERALPRAAASAKVPP